MTLEVLQSRKQIRDARDTMKSRGISFTDSRFAGLLKRLGLAGGLSLGDELKSWDILKTVELLEQELPRDATILDVGCFCSEVLLCLHEIGFTHLIGSDLNADIGDMPFADTIQYRQEDFLNSGLEDGSVDAITSISVLEHGFDGPAYLAEMSRLLKPGGLLLTSFDYWPDKIDTGDTQFFGMSWTLFSREEVLEFITLAREYQLEPLGEISTEASARPIRCAGYAYTFAWLGLKKRAGR